MFHRIPRKIIKFIFRHKVLSVLILISLLGGGVLIYKKAVNKNSLVAYSTSKVQKGALIVSVSGTGQVSASNQVDIKPKASGDIIYIGVKTGQEVKSDALIAQLDSRDAQKSVRDAEASLENAKISFEKFKLENSKDKLETNLKKAYDDGFNSVSNAFLDIPSIISGLNGILLDNNLTSLQSNISYYADATKDYDNKALQYKDEVYITYQNAQKVFDKNFENYKNVTRYSDVKTIESLINETYETTKTVTEAVKNTINFIQFYKTTLTDRGLKYNSGADTALTALNSYTGKANSHLSNLLSIRQTIDTKKDAFTNADLDLKSQKLSLKQKENSLLDAKEKLSDYSIRAPFQGVIAKLDAEKGDSVSDSTVLGVLATKQKIAEISLNEVDVASVKVGQKATLTFDAIPDLTLTGKVLEIDSIGAVSQGVVTYNLKIGFDAQDDRVKTAMSVSTSIITNVKSNTLLVPNSAVKSQSGKSFVELAVVPLKNLTPGQNSKNIAQNISPRRQMVKVGISNDEFTEILSGLKEGDIVVTRTVQPNSVQAQNGGQPATFRFPGASTGGGNFRAR